LNFGNRHLPGQIETGKAAPDPRPMWHTQPVCSLSSRSLSTHRMCSA
jgi:hypothetical protein